MDEDRIRRALDELARDPARVSIELSRGEWFCIISQLQLALRHPGNDGPIARLAQHLIITIAASISAVSEELRELIRRGFDPKHDAPASPPPPIPPAADADTADERRFYEEARRQMFPKVRGAVFGIFPLEGEPDPKLCVELGAMILFDRPILLTVPRGRTVPLSLRTIAHEIVELDADDVPGSQRRFHEAMTRMADAGQFRGRPPKEDDHV